MTYTIHAMLLDRFENKLKSFQRKFEKYGDGNLEYSVSEPYIYEFNEDDINSVKSFDGREVIDITVAGEYRINNYEFIASLQFDSESGRNIISGSAIPELYLTRCECDHCRTTRARTKTIILRKGDEYIQVGNSCVKDYLGVNIERYASYLSFWRDLDEMEENNQVMITSARPAYIVQDILLETARIVEKTGYISRERAWELEKDPTSSIVWHSVQSTTKHEYTAAHREAVTNVRAMVASKEDDFGYVTNLKTLLNNKYVVGKNLGLVVSSFGFYAAELARMEREKVAAITAHSEWIGTIGDKLKFVAVPECIFSCESQWGYSYIYRFILNGNEVIWRTGTGLDTSMEYEFTGTIKAHNEYRGKKQTELTRCRNKPLALRGI